MQIEGIGKSSKDMDSLRRILEKIQGHPVSEEEALEVSESLICYFKTLADQSNAEV